MKFEKFLLPVSDICASVFQDMTDVEISSCEVIANSDTNNYLTSALITYEDKKAALKGDFVLGFSDIRMAERFAKPIAKKVGLSMKDDFDETLREILSEYLNIVAGRIISYWDNMGLEVEIGRPQSTGGKSFRQVNGQDAKNYCIILKIGLISMVLSVSFIENEERQSTEKRILLVDDSKIIRLALAKIFEGKGFEISNAENGLEGVAKFKSIQPDLTFMDLDMPKMGGLTAISKIRQMDSEANIIILTSSSKKNQILEAAKYMVKGYLIKPIDEDKVLELVDKCFEETEASTNNDQPPPGKSNAAQQKVNIVKEIISKFSRDEFSLPALPNVYVKFKELLKKGANFEEIGDFLRQDISISSKLISVSNSAFYRGVEQNKTLEQALARLGIKETTKHVEAICNRMLYSGIDKKYEKIIENLWEHSISCAHASQVVAEELKMETEEDTFTLGLLHDAGRLVIISIVNEMERNSDIGEDVDTLGLIDALDSYHGQFGKALFKRWNFSDIYGDISMNHDNLEEVESPSNDMLIVIFSNALVKSMGYVRDGQPEIKIEDQEISARLDIHSEIIRNITEQVQSVVEESKKLHT